MLIFIGSEGLSSGIVSFLVIIEVIKYGCLFFLDIKGGGFNVLVDLFLLFYELKVDEILYNKDLLDKFIYFFGDIFRFI